ncbi:DUF5959 family protein [Streptomyces sp. NPDC020801]|uniref:DUF5959 family protein n=1 Tax=unclassified Streptomyces TaxID=2593676 RepID=UPI0037B8062F
MTDALAGQFLVDGPFARGCLKTWVVPDDLRHRQEAMDVLDAGQDIAWRQGTRVPEVFVARDVQEERARATISAGSWSRCPIGRGARPGPVAGPRDAYRTA